MSKETEAAQPVEAEPTAQAPANLEDMDEDQLRRLIDNPEAEVLPVAASEPDEPEETPVEGLPEAEPVVAEEAEAEAQMSDPATDEDRLASLERGLEEEKLRREAEAARNEHLRFALDRSSGEVAHLKNQARQPAVQPQSSEYSEEYREQPAMEPILAEARGEIDQMRRERATNAALSESQRLQSQHAGFWHSLDKAGNGDRVEFEKSFNTRLGTELTGMGVQDSVASGDAKRTGSIMRAAYTAALAETRLEWLGKVQQQNRAAAPSSETARQRKLEAATGADSPRPTARPRARALDEMSADEIKSEIDRREVTGVRVD